jgi:DNA-binding MarR family transcriptional regulator
MSEVHPRLSRADQHRLRLVHQLRAISVQLDLARGAFARANALHDTDVRALITLLDADRADIAATAGWLGAQLGLTSPATTALIDRLETAGYVHRQPSPVDRRKVEIQVSRSAIALGWTFFGPLLTAMITAMRPFDVGELDTIERFLREVAAVTQWQDGPASRPTEHPTLASDVPSRRLPSGCPPERRATAPRRTL